MGKGQNLYKKAKNIIPGGTMLLSKRPEMYLPENWPSYYDKTKGCYVWDLDGNKFLDMHIMGIGTNTLGYNHPKVDAAVLNAIKKGNMSTLNCPEEVRLAERLVELHPWAEMVRFARTGGEANAIAIRIARAASGREKVAICGYHGWHDWYLASNLGKTDNLDGHLLPGLDILGVPKSLRNTIIPFEYNDLQLIQDIVKQNPDLGAIKMEVMRNSGPNPGYLEGIRKLCDDNNIILIFDECTSGFRETFGGIHIKFNVTPDMCMFGKALGNGYAITSVIGKRNVMEAAQKSFISSTFWTERIGPTAGITTLNVMEEERSWEVITEQGSKIQQGWTELNNSLDLKIKISGIPALSSFTIESKEWLKCKTFIAQEMLKNNILASNTVYLCTHHSDLVIKEYFDKLYPILREIERHLVKDIDLSEKISGPICHDGFKRLN